MIFTMLQQLQRSLLIRCSSSLNPLLYRLVKGIRIAALRAGWLCLICVPGLLLMTTSPTHLASAASIHYSVTARPSITAARINNILCQAHSPACGTGTALYRLGVKYGIDPIFALAFFDKESTFGKYGMATTTRSLGNIRCTSDCSLCKHGFRAYHSWEAGYADWYRLIRTLYVNKWHLRTIQQIVQKYAPPSENDTKRYIIDVEHDVDCWRRHYN